MPTAKRKDLTPRQREIYEFLKDKIQNRGYGPTVREIGRHFNIRSPNGVMGHLNALEKKGFITRERYLSRAIQLAREPKRRQSLPVKGLLYGKGVFPPTEAEERMDFSDLLTDDNDKCYRMADSSLSENGILPGDILILCKDQSYADGTRVIAHLEDVGLVLRRYFRKPNRVRLEADDTGKSPLECTDDQVLGALRAIVRRY